MKFISNFFLLVWGWIFLFSGRTEFGSCLSVDLQDELMAAVWLSGAAYCGKEKYKTMQLMGPAKGFVCKDTLYDKTTDLQGYIGVLPGMENIYVVIRGSSSVMNWLDDFEVKQVPYESYPECGCNVHNGFYRSALGVANKTIQVVRALKRQLPGYSVVVTGHSYGASCGQLLAMELEKAGLKPKLFNYGQPRVGDKKYAGFVNALLGGGGVGGSGGSSGSYYRITHNKDIVPHVPPMDGFGYYHSCTELFEDVNGGLKTCSEVQCEDPSCADQYKLTETNTEDHSVYLGHVMSCENSTVV